MDLDDGLGDDWPPPPLLPPEDRIWRHPSEVAPRSGNRRTIPDRLGGSGLWQVGLLAGSISALLTVGLVLAGGGFRVRTVMRSAAPAVERVVTPAASTVMTTPGSPANAIVDIADNLRPAIVQIRVSGGEGPGSGSGVIFRSDGHVLTNHHVVDGARRITVVMANGEEEAARLIGSDAETDIAVVKVDKADLASAPLGSAVALRAGQLAVAIGSPLGLAGGPSVSVGVISAVGREIDANDDGPPLLDMIQTDAPIAPGSSGGALVDSTGAVIGVTTAIAVSEVGAEGLGFATPIDIARDVADQIIAGGRAVHVWLGVEGEDVDPGTARELGVVGGAMIRDVRAGSPAGKAGVAERDVIVAVDGVAVRSMGGLKVQLRTHRPGDEVTLTFHRGKVASSLKVRLTERPARALDGRGGRLEGAAYDGPVSTPGPFGSGNPFEGLFGELAKLFANQGPLNLEVARQLAQWLAVEGQPESNVEPLERIRYGELTRVAELQVAGATGLATSAGGGVVRINPVGRSEWARQTLDAYRTYFEGLAASMSAPATAPDVDDLADLADPTAELLGGVTQVVGPLLIGMQAGTMVGHLAQRAFGQYDLPVPRPPSDELLVVPVTINDFAADWSLPLDEVRLWVCLSELSHHAVISRPHVRARLEALLSEYVRGFKPDSRLLEERLGDVDPTNPASFQAVLGDPAELLGAMQTPEQRQVLGRVEALVAAIEGYVDHVMDTLGHGLIGSYGSLSEALRRRRVERSDGDQFVERLFGLELSQAQYDRGSTFVAGVVERAGDEGLARLWNSERELPTPAEVDAPGLWLERIDIPTD